MVNLLDSWNIHPVSVTGHSSGEIAAAYCAGAISLKDAMLNAYARGCATTDLAEKGVEGAMAAVSMAREELNPIISNLRNGKAVIACSNSPSSFTVSGDRSAVDELQQILRARGIYNRRLVVGVAYHSHHMALVADSYRAAISSIQAKKGGKIKFFSSVTGKKVKKSNLGADYWVNNLVSEVRFSQSLRQLANHEGPDSASRVQTLVEIGPHGALAGPIRQILQEDENVVKTSIQTLSVLTRKKDAVVTALGVASELFVSGHEIRLSVVNGNWNSGIPPLIDLPSYAWNHTKSYTAESRISKAYRQRENPRTDILGAFDVHSSPLEPRWRQIIRLSESPWLRDHSIQSTIVYPAAGYITMAIEAARQRKSWGAPGAHVSGYQFRDVAVSSALLIPETPGEVEVVITLKAFSESVRSPSNLWDEFSVSSVSADNRWTEHCRGLIAVKIKSNSTNPVNGLANENCLKAATQGMVADFDAICTRAIDTAGLYGRLSEVGMQYGPTFANIHELRCGSGRCISQIHIPDTSAVVPMQFEHVSVVHPTTLDTIFQTYLPALAEQMGQLSSPVVPIGIEDMFISHEICSKAGEILTAYTSTTRKDNRFFSAEIDIFDDEYSTGKHPVIHVGEMTMAALDWDHTDESSDRLPSRAFNMKWAPDVDLMSESQIKKLIHQRASASLTNNPSVENADATPEVSKTIQLTAEYLCLLAHKNPAQRVLALGCCSGSAATAVLSVLFTLCEGVAPFKSLHCSDTKPAILQSWESKFPSWSSSISHKEFPAETNGSRGHDIVSEDLYDLVVIFKSGSSQDASKALSSSSLILVPGGRLLLVDENLQSPFPSLAISQDQLSERQSSLAYAKQAEGLGFKSHGEWPEGLVAFHMNEEPARRDDVSEVLIIVADGTPPPVDLPYLQSFFAELNITSDVVLLENADPRPTQACIMLTELSKSVFTAPTEAEWSAIKKISHGGAGALWLTRGSGGDICTNPEASLTQGFTRTIRSETGDRPIVTLDLDSGNPLAPQATAECIANVFQRVLMSASSGAVIEQELIERDGLLLVPRLVQDIEVTENIKEESGKIAQVKPSLRPLGELGSSRLLVETPGLLDTLYFASDERVNVTLPHDQVEVDVKAAGINFKDVMMAMGQIPVEDLGCECSGLVSAIGEDIASNPDGLRVGDRVMCLSSGSFCTKLRLDARLAERIPETMSFETASAIPITHVTAYHSLHNIARLRKGETILIHAATGGLGQALVEMSQLVGAEVFVTVGSAEKKALIMDRFGLVEERILYSRDMSFAQDVMHSTAGRGVDVIVNSLAGEALRNSWTCIAPNGRFVELGQRDITINTRLDMSPFARNASFTAFNLAFTMRSDPQAAREVLIKVLELFASGALRGPDPLETYAFSELQQAFRKMQTGRHMGKLVAVARQDDVVKHIAPAAEGPLFFSDAAYLLVGGLGGIGRATAVWMASRGARHIICLNRSGLSNASAQETVRAVEAAGCTATVFACDVADPAQLTATLEAARHQLPPIRGVIQGAMVLRDCMLDKMTLEDYLAVLRPKLHGTRNLHDHLPKDLDFFLMESSVSGIVGNTAQAAYAAANTFLDAFARYRRSNGQPATTIDIGAVSGVGYLSQNKELELAMQRQGFEFTDEAGLMRLLEFSIRNSTRDLDRAHIITGLGAWNPETSLPALSAPMFSRFRMDTSTSTEVGKAEATLHQALKQSKDIKSAIDLILTALVNQIVSHTGVPVENMSKAKSLQDYGIDSLAAVEFKNWISKEMESVVPIFELMAAESLSDLAAKIAGRSRLVVSSNGA